MPATWLATKDVELSALARFPGNARRGNVDEIRKSLRRHGQYRAIVVRAHDGGFTVLAGNHTADALVAEGHESARCEVIECSDDEARRIAIADNRTAELGDYDTQALAVLLSALDGDLDGTGYTPHDLDDIADLLGRDEDGAGGPAGGPEDRPSLADRFLIPPFDVLDARQGAWRTRKQQWLSLEFASEEGRDGGLVRHGKAFRDSAYYAKKAEVEQRLGRPVAAAEFDAEHYTAEGGVTAGTSIFDPVLCELAYRWFSPADGLVVDPFAGGSVRGLVAAILGRRYTGNDLSEPQVKANIGQGEEFQRRGLIESAPTWSVGDSAEWVQTLEPESADLIFTCPPYYSLERYGGDPADLSAMTHKAFDATYAKILAGAAAALRSDRFAVVVVGDARDPKGALHDLRGSTIRAAESAGLAYVNGAVLVTPVGSVRVVAARPFIATRTLGRTHQDVLVFCKGSRSAAAKACGDVDVHLPEEITDAFDDAGSAAA